jgi:hypothetical protein
MHSPDRDTHLAAIADEQAKADARRRALDRRAADLVATLRVVIEALEGHADFEALEQGRFRVAAGRLVEGAFPTFAEVRALFADRAYVARELATLGDELRRLQG